MYTVEDMQREISNLYMEAKMRSIRERDLLARIKELEDQLKEPKEG